MPTETVDPRFVALDRWPTVSAVEAMIEGQMAAVASLVGQAERIAAAADAAALRLKRGGRLVYAGAGTSGRIAVQDGVELRPTFDWPEDRVVFLMAGGPGALMQAVEGAEDDTDAARRDVAAAGVDAGDVVIGVAASGTTPFTVAVVEAARAAGALTVAVANNPGTPLLAIAEHAILADTGSEIVAGSTRMKAGTAQKAAINLFSTATMVRMGRVYRGQMVDMRVSNAKLRARAARMVAELAGVDVAAAGVALEAAGYGIRRAVLVARGMAVGEADAALVAADGDLGAVLQV